MSRRLLLDAGNSSVKWAVVEDGRWIAQGRCAYENSEELVPLLTPRTRCVVASVASADREARLATVLALAGRMPTRLTSGARFGDLANGYVPPEQLGVDRWMAMIAARARVHGPALVVSAGTALTVDAVTARGEFIGGLILPGASLMRGALATGTARVSAARGTWQPFPRCTADAVESGIIAALGGAIAQQAARLESEAGTVPACLLTGGDAPWLLPQLGPRVEHVPALVLEGIERVTREETIA